jgi:hypothetical protein
MFSFRAPFVEMLPLLPDRALVVLFFVGLFSLPFANRVIVTLPISSSWDDYHKVIFEYHSLLSALNKR